jgi:hypothetical protein
VARVYEHHKASRDFILQVGSRKLCAGRRDCFFWSSRRPPRRLRLLSPALLIDLGSLQW